MSAAWRHRELRLLLRQLMSFADDWCDVLPICISLSPAVAVRRRSLRPIAIIHCSNNALCSPLAISLHIARMPVRPANSNAPFLRILRGYHGLGSLARPSQQASFTLTVDVDKQGCQANAYTHKRAGALTLVMRPSSGTASRTHVCEDFDMSCAPSRRG